MTAWLALDCSTALGSVAAGSPGTPAAEILITGRRHAAELVPSARECLRLANLDWTDLTGFIVGDGPGSFTGLRIAFATAAGFLRQHPAQVLLTGPSLLAAAFVGSSLSSGEPVAALFDALRGEVHAAVYQFSGGLRTLLPPTLTTLETLRRSGVVPALAVGDGAAAYPEAVRSWTGRDPVVPPAGAPRASALIELAGLGVLRRVTDLASWEPTYGRPAEAQTRWEHAHGRPLPGATGD